MQKTIIKNIYRDTKLYLNKKVLIRGWVRTVRSSNAFGFIELNDGTFFKGVQVVFEKDLENYDEITRTTIGSAIEVRGLLVESPGKGQTFEIKAERVKIVSLADPEYPLQKKRHSFEFLRTIAHLRARSNTFSAVFRVRSKLSYAVHQFFQERNFVYLQSPIITTNDCEGAGEMFRVTTLDAKKPPLRRDYAGQALESSNKTGNKFNDSDSNNKLEKKESRVEQAGSTASAIAADYGANNNGVDFNKDFFGKEAGLTVSGQLNAEAMSMAFRNVYTFGPTFRAENSNTTRHASEFWMIEPEIAFADLNDDMDLAEEMIKYLVGYLYKHCGEEMEFFSKFIFKGLRERLDNLLASSFERITYTEAIKILLKSEKKFEYPVKWGVDLQTEHERYITDEVYKKPVFVTDYPKDIKAFYMRLNEDKKTVAAVDLLVPGVGEIIGGSQREERLDILEKRMDECGLNKKDYWWYLELRKYGGVKHAGFGLGFERAIMYFTGMENIRDVIPFPRVPKSAEF